MCDCISTVNKMLAERNTVLLEPMFINPKLPTRLFVETRQIETGRGKKKAASMFASFCPFCGGGVMAFFVSGFAAGVCFCSIACRYWGSAVFSGAMAVIWLWGALS